MRREIKELRLNSSVALRKPLLREANLKRLQFAREHRDWTGVIKEGHVVRSDQIFPVPEEWVLLGMKRSRCSDAALMPSACGWVQLFWFRFRFSVIMCPTEELD